METDFDESSQPKNETEEDQGEGVSQTLDLGRLRENKVKIQDDLTSSASSVTSLETPKESIKKLRSKILVDTEEDEFEEAAADSKTKSDKKQRNSKKSTTSGSKTLTLKS